MARADDFKNLKNEAFNMYNDRINLIHQTKNEVSNLLADFSAQDKQRAKEIADLRAVAQAYVTECTKGSKTRAQDIANMLADFNARDKERAKEVDDLKAETQALLAQFNEGDKVRAKEVADLRAAAQAYVAECTKGSKTRARDVANMLAGFNARDKERAKEVADLRAEVHTLLNNFKKEREKAAAAWRDLLATMADARGGVATKEEIIPKKPKPKPKKTTEKVSGLVDKEKKVLSIIKNNPEGISLPEIAYVMGVAFVTITKDIKKLLADGLIKKKENRYFAL